jgi:polysaccharide pyruvyl transferase WcaK-like protein
MCLQYGKVKNTTGFSKKVSKKLSSKSIFINLRDHLTKNHYNFNDAVVSCCPCILYLQKFKNIIDNNAHKVLYSCHPHLVKDIDNKKIINAIKEVVPNDIYLYTDHSYNRKKPIQEEVDKTILNYYCKSKLVVTTRLHGAIIAYALGIPYIAIPYDKKITAFYKDYGNGLIVENIKDLPKAIQSYKNIEIKEIKLKEVQNVADRIVNIINNIN